MQSTGTLEIIERLKRSTNGNSRLLVKVGGLVARTPVDSDLTDVARSLEGRRVAVKTRVLRGYETITDLEPVPVTHEPVRQLETAAAALRAYAPRVPVSAKRVAQILGELEQWLREERELQKDIDGAVNKA